MARPSFLSSSDAKADRRDNQDDVLVELVDERSGRSFFVSMVDTLKIDDAEYQVMYNVEASDSDGGAPEIIIMRRYRLPSGEYAFASIRNPKELDRLFELFFRHYQASSPS